jgi:hypothetical protein
VGYITLEYSGNPSENDNGAETLVSGSLVNPTVYAAAASSAPSGKTVNFSGGVPTDLDGSYMLEITNGSQEGWWTTVDVSTATSITVTDDFPSGLAADVGIAVRKFTTVLDLLGENAPGLVAGDEVQLFDAFNQSGATIIWDGVQWSDFVTEFSANDAIVYPGTALKIVRRSEDGGSFVLSGTVKTTKTQIDIFPGDNWIGQVNATGGTFGTMELATSILTTDFVDWLAPDEGEGQSATTFISDGSDLIDFVTEFSGADFEIKEGTGFFIRRDTEEDESTITIPAQVISND